MLEAGAVREGLHGCDGGEGERRLIAASRSASTMPDAWAPRELRSRGAAQQIWRRLDGVVGLR